MHRSRRRSALTPRRRAGRDRRPRSALQTVTFSRNFGHQAAISAGLGFATGDAVAIMDGDLQDPPEELGRFLQKWRDGWHVVYAIRTARKEGALKRAAYRTFYRTLDIVSDIEIPLDSGDFCVMDRRVRDVPVDEMPERNRFVRSLRAYAGFRQIGLRCERQQRVAGEPKYSLRKLVHLALDGLIDFSTFPLLMGYTCLAVVNFGILIPSGPGYVGVFEAMVLLALAAFHIAEERALLVALLIHSCHFLPLVGWGLLLIILRSISAPRRAS
jgi:polyisoprenyl-phosphate glycosyltransferase